MKSEHQLAVMHWGTYQVTTREGNIAAVEPVAWDRNPSRIGQSLTDSVTGASRIRRPAVRQGYLQHGPASREGRGKEPFVEVSWEVALNLVARELKSVKAQGGNEAIFGGSYGWASAGRFHHAQSQLHRFLKGFGGYTASTNTYSSAAGERVLPHILGPLSPLHHQHTHWSVLAEYCQCFVAIGGLPLRNAQVNGGAANDHALKYWLEKLHSRGVEFINISPVKNDLSAISDASWLAIKPGTDTALLLALCHTLIAEDRYDRAFVASHTVGFETFKSYLLGEVDGSAKTAQWAAAITGLSAQQIIDLARTLSGKRTMINISWSIQRARQGEQAYWATVALTALLGQIGTAGGGLAFGYACTNLAGADRAAFSGPRLPAGKNQVSTVIPVARLADMLLNPGGEYQFDGQQCHYPDIRLVYWAGGNAFHHHQDINRLIDAWRRPETVVVHEQYWTAQAKHADIVLPVTTSLERNDIGSASHDGFMIAMRQHIPPVGEARDDYAIFCQLAQKLGFYDKFSEGRSPEQWLEQMYEDARPRAAAENIELPAFADFWQQGKLEFNRPATPQIFLADFRADPQRFPLATPSGKIELFSQTVASFDYAECPGYPYWDAGIQQQQQSLARQWPLHLLSSQPRTRLHSQYDQGSVSRASKIHGREPLWMHPNDAASRSITEGSIVRVFNQRGAILAGVHLSTDILPGVVQMSTGAWYDPLDPTVPGSLDKHGNPNVLTEDRGSSRLGQGCSAQTCQVEIERWQQPLPEITAFNPPLFVE
ncbi:molybdopterin-dependent oxidoreductase [Winslowiella iniecta]|uniref:Biotin transporter BioY n=1 Tax=Winslowiella iniecta TaxID=1560201 RepID=A0A0L7T4F4_9GAMM|nr:molybdopterin-dependent oxidoreductase [Winslowiella iniecta]KOC90076.1 biotin transporter BioY [Winslowiella iniecta]KOC94071.1 biotin transporter BioY [Winslowiella iniecta]